MFGRGLFDPGRAVGVIEVLLNNRWGVVCENQPEDVARINARVLCRKFFSDDASVSPRPIHIPVARSAMFQPDVMLLCISFPVFDSFLVLCQHSLFWNLFSLQSE